MRFKIITLGCKVNSYESEIIKEKLLSCGYKETNEDSAEIIIINTCSVTNTADSKSKKLIRHYKKINPDSILVACGCMIQNKYLNDDKCLNDLEIDITIGNKDKSRIDELITNYINERKKIKNLYHMTNLEFEDMDIKNFSSHTRAFLKIQDGCNNYCSYCVIPFLRGNIRSKDFNKAVNEAKELVLNGHKELVLTGIHTGSYGRGYDFDLVDLIDEISKIDDLMRIRISSIEVTELSDKFLNLLRDNKKVCNHLHIPLQSGSDKILGLMNRKYNKSFYKEMISKIRNVRSDISISTDVIVGFPGESEEDFKDCYDFCEEIGFSKIHVFPFSKRDKTKAAMLPNQLNNSEKKDRSRRLIELSGRLEQQYMEKFIGKNVYVLIEEYKDGYSIGHTDNYLKIGVKKKIDTNHIYQIKCREIKNDLIIGDID